MRAKGFGAPKGKAVAVRGGSVLERRKRDLARELKRVKADLGYLSRTLEDPEAEVDLSRLRSRREEDARRGAKPAETSRIRSSAPVGEGGAGGGARRVSPGTPDAPHARRNPAPDERERLADYLSSSFEPVRPLRHERRLQRNKAIVMLVFALLVLLWVLFRFLL